MVLPPRLKLALTQAQFAVLIAVVELAIGELFKNAVEYGFSWYRRWILDMKGRFRVSSRPFVNCRSTVILNSILIVFTAVVIDLELSIEETGVLTQKPGVLVLIVGTDISQKAAHFRQKSMTTASIRTSSVLDAATNFL